MAISYLSPINLNQQELQNALIQNLGTDPLSPLEGQIWCNTTTNTIRWFDGTVVQTLGELTNRLDEFAPPQGTISFNNQALTNLANPVNPQDAATKAYVDQSEIGLDVKASVVVASTGPGNLASSFAAGQVMDGITLATGNRILLKDQANGAQNGIYVVSSTGAPVPSTDCNSSANYVTGAFVYVEEGSINQGASWVVNTQGTIIPGTTSVSWVQFSGTSPTSNNLTGGVLGSLPYQSSASTTTMLAGNTAATDTVLVSHGTGSTALAPSLQNAPALSAANLTNFPTFNQSTTGNAATATIASSVAGGTLGSVPYQTATSATTLLPPNTTNSDQVLVSHGTGTVGQPPSFSNAPALSAANMTSFPTLNQSSTGNAATATALTGGVTGSIPYQTGPGATALLAPNLAGTDQVLVSHGSGTVGQPPVLSNSPALSASNMTSFPTLNQSTTGNAATATLAVAATTATNIAGGIIGSIPYQSAADTTTLLAGNSAASDMVLVSHGTGSAPNIPALINAPALSAANLTDFPILNQDTTGVAAGLSATLAVTSGGTGAITPAGAKTNLGFMTRFAINVGDGASTLIMVTHNLGTQDVIASLYSANAPFNVVMCDVQMTSVNTLTLNFAVAPSANQYRLVVIG